MQQLEIQNVKIDVKTLPIILKLVYNGNEKQYILNLTKNKKGVYLNTK
jgi:hypothetical protein